MITFLIPPFLGVHLGNPWAVQVCSGRLVFPWKVSPLSSARERADACMILRGCTSLQLGTKPATSTTSFHHHHLLWLVPPFFCQPFVCPVDRIYSLLCLIASFPSFSLLRQLPEYIYYIHIFFSLLTRLVLRPSASLPVLIARDSTHAECRLESNGLCWTVNNPHSSSETQNMSSSRSDSLKTQKLDTDSFVAFDHAAAGQ